MGCGSCCGKCILIFTNIWFLLFGLLFLGLGILVKVGLDSYLGDYATAIIVQYDHVVTEVTGTSAIDIFNKVAIAFIVFGCIVVFIAILGMCGACCDNKCMLATYATIVLVILLVQVAIVIVVATGQFNGIIEEEVKEIIIEDYGGDQDTDLKSVIINGVQHVFGCCGWDNSSDYDNAKKWSRRYNTTTTSRTIIIPASCCKFSSSDTVDHSCLTAPTPTNSNKDKGCFEAVSAFITSEYTRYAIIAVSAFMVDEFILVIIAIILACKAGKKRKRYHDDIEVTVRAGTGRKGRY